ncbi:MAG: hypothetical protein L3K10_06980 [Thermoplasmata archaeon]|nr:hypothetical protein [Thermoplasmata archaeon]
MVTALLVATLMVLVLPVGVVSATSTPAADAPRTLWAYGAVETVDFHGFSHNGWEYTGNATYGFSVILNQTNTTATTFELDVNRTMGALIHVHYCSPSCSAPRYFGNESAHFYESVAAAANFTTTGSVDENGHPVSALALNNSQTHLLANETLTASAYLPAAGLPVSRSAYVSAHVRAEASMGFSPGLGILPTDLSTAQTWNSTAQFSAHASATYSKFFASQGPLGTERLGPVLGNLSIPFNGTVSLHGAYSPSDQVTLGQVSYSEVTLTVTGPFAVREGFILVPSATDLFSGGASSWAGQENGSANAAMSYLDARASYGGHVGIGASRWVYGSSTAGPAAGISSDPGIAEISPSTGPRNDTVPATTLQGTPEAVGSAQSQQTCLTTGSGCPAAVAAGTPNLRGLIGLVGIAVVVIVVPAAIVLVAERRRMPPPTYPNAALYPPGGSILRARKAPEPPPPPPADDDPLRNLW